MRVDVPTDDSVDDGGAEGAADGAGGEGQAGRRREEGVGRGELHAGDQKRQGPGLPDAGDDVEADLRLVPGRLDISVADCHDEEHGEGDDEGGLHVLEVGRVEGDGDGGDEGGEGEAELTDRNGPGIAFEAQVEHDLGRHRVDGGVVDPTAG